VQEKIKNASPVDSRDSGEDMSLYQSPEYYDQQMKLLPPDIRPFHLHNAVEAMKKAEALRPGALVLDLCCGTGWAALSLAAAHPGVFFVGVDNSEQMLQVARERASAAGMRNVFFICCNAETLLWSDFRIPEEISRGRRLFDAVITAFGLSVVPQWHSAMSASWRLLRPGGVYGILDLHFTKDGEDELSKEEALARKALPSQDHSRRLWDALEDMPDLDTCFVHSHTDYQQYYCALGQKKRIGSIDLATMSYKTEDGGEAPAVQRWDPDSGEYVPLESQEEINEAVGATDAETGEEGEEEGRPIKTQTKKKLPPKRSSETISAYCKRINEEFIPGHGDSK